MAGGGLVEVTQRFFVSYTGVDVRWAEWVAWTLEAAGHEALIQAWDFGPGSHFVGEMQKALGGDRRTVAVVSAAYLASVFGTEEWQAVWAADPAGARRLLLVVRVEDCERPGLLRQVVSVDVFGVDEDVARDRLLAVIVLGRRKPVVAPGFPVSEDRGRSAGAVGSAGVAPVFPVDLPAVWNVPPRLARFVGREVLLAGVVEELAARGVAAVCAVQGAGGMGKTALAVEYAHRHMDDFDVVWWVPGQNAELAAGQVAALGVALGLGEGADWVAVAGQLRRLGARWLVVVDNVEEWEVVTAFRPSDPRGRLLVTSRLTGLDGAGGAVEVGEFSAAEAVALLAARVPGIGLEAAGRIVALLGFLPLAVEQAAGYLRQTGMPAVEYAALVESRLGDMLRRGRVADRPGVTVANLWALSMARLRAEAPAAGALLELCALCGPDPIPLDLVTGGTAELDEGPMRVAAADPVAWADTVGAVVGYSLARRDGAALTVHRLIAAATRAQMTPHDRAATEAAAVRLLAAAVPTEVRDPQGWPRWRGLLPHVQAALDTDHDGGSERTVRAVSWLCDRTGMYLEHHGRPDSALPYLQRGLALDETHLGAEHPDTLASRNNLAGAYRAAGRVEQAIGLFEQTLTDCERVLGAEHPDTLTSRNNLAGAYRAAGRVEQAIGLYEQTLTDSERVLGAEHPDTLASRNNLAYAYEAAGRVEQAIGLFEQTLTDRERVLGAEHPDTLTSRNNLAYAYETAGRVEQAIGLYEQTLTGRERVLGAEHPDTLVSRSNLAGAYESAGRVEQAIGLFEQTLTDRERVLGAEHPSTLVSRNNLAGAYETAGRVEQAIGLYEQTLTDRERVLGVEHPATLTSRNNLAYAYESAGRVEHAIGLYEQTLAVAQRVLDQGHPSLATFRANLERAQGAAAGRPGAAPR
ncbi:FxSxx-COOH system tetratricopeptide repeat protein [Frankia sp. AgW1.1]|uniref:FxSxx-COOH system tetratricopeptide repeat protein n=2 Tax=unclassified Frankia TaxID=2632575 RepID=UPI0027DBA4B7|nr:FxSxx-COOH system tetratricopeptide repeat protein [Frankia sp. AgW1.1]